VLLRGPVTPVVDQAEIRRIATQTREKLQRERERYSELIRRLNALIEVEAELPAINHDQLRQQRLDLQVRVDGITRHLKRFDFWDRLALVEAAERAAIRIGYTSEGSEGPSGSCIEFVVRLSVDVGRPITPHSARRIIRAYIKIFITNKLSAVLGGTGSLWANAEVVKATPALWFWEER